MLILSESMLNSFFHLDLFQLRIDWYFDSSLEGITSITYNIIIMSLESSLKPRVNLAVTRRILFQSRVVAFRTKPSLSSVWGNRVISHISPFVSLLHCGNERMKSRKADLIHDWRLSAVQKIILIER